MTIPAMLEAITASVHAFTIEVNPHRLDHATPSKWVADLVAIDAVDDADIIGVLHDSRTLYRLTVWPRSAVGHTDYIGHDLADLLAAALGNDAPWVEVDPA